MKVPSENSEPIRAPRANSAFSRTIINCNPTTAGRRTISAASAADPNTWAPILDKMSSDDKHAVIKKDQPVACP